MPLKLLTFLFCSLLLTGCISGRPKQETYTGANGQTTIILSNKDLCTQSCNDDYARCMDTDDAKDNGGVNGPKGMFGASAECRASLKKCLPGCRAE